MNVEHGQIQRRNATFKMTHQCTAETGKNLATQVEALGLDILEVARVAPMVPACFVRALEMSGSAVGTHVARKTADVIAVIVAIGCYATMSGHYQAASLRESLLLHVEQLLVAVDRMDAAAAAEQLSTLRRNFATFAQARRAEGRFCLNELALPLYHAASMALQTRAYGFDCLDETLVRVEGDSHAFIAARWPRTAGQLRAGEAP